MEDCGCKKIELSGWVCPRCQRVNAPFINECPCSKFPITIQPIIPYIHPYINPYPSPNTWEWRWGPYDYYKVTCDTSVANKTEYIIEGYSTAKNKV